MINYGHIIIDRTSYTLIIFTMNDLISIISFNHTIEILTNSSKTKAKCESMPKYSTY